MSTPKANTRIPFNVVYEHQHSQNICIKWKRMSQHVFVAEAYLRTSNSTQPLKSIDCPRYVGQTFDEVIAFVDTFLAQRGKQASHDVKWNATSLDFNTEFSNEYWSRGTAFTHYRFENNSNGVVYLVVTRGGDASHPLFGRHVGESMCAGRTTRNDLIRLKLSLGRYETYPLPREQSMLLGGSATEQWFELCFLSEVENSTDRERLGAPGLTIARPRINQKNASGTGTSGTNWIERTGYKSVLLRLSVLNSRSSDIVACPVDLDLQSFSKAVRAVVALTPEFKGKFSIIQNKKDHTLELIRV